MFGFSLGLVQLKHSGHGWCFQLLMVDLIPNRFTETPGKFKYVQSILYTLPETNTAPENGWFGDYFPFGARPIFRCYVSFRERTCWVFEDTDMFWLCLKRWDVTVSLTSDRHSQHQWHRGDMDMSLMTGPSRWGRWWKGRWVFSQGSWECKKLPPKSYVSPRNSRPYFSGLWKPIGFP